MVRHRTFFIIYGIANAGLILYGLLALSNPNILLESFSLQIYQFPLDATLAVRYLLAMFRLLGLFNLILGATGLFLLSRYRISHQVWLIYTVIALTVFRILDQLSWIILSELLAFLRLSNTLFLLACLSLQSLCSLRVKLMSSLEIKHYVLLVITYLLIPSAGFVFVSLSKWLVKEKGYLHSRYPTRLLRFDN